MFKKIGSFFLGLGKYLFGVAKTVTEKALAEIGPLARDVVLSVERRSNGNMSGSDKFELAKAMLIEQLSARGIYYTMSIINTAIEKAEDVLTENGEEIKCVNGNCQ